MPTNGDMVLVARRPPCYDWRPAAIFGVKAVHTVAFFVIQSAIVYLLYKAARRQTDRKAAVAASIAIGECAIFAGNRFRCPLTDLAERLGSGHGAVIDTFLPPWLAANIGRIYGPLLAVALVLHARNLSKARLRGALCMTSPARARPVAADASAR